MPLIPGNSAAVPGWKESDSHQSWVHLVWLPEADAHVPHGHARHDQPHSLPRYCLHHPSLSSTVTHIQIPPPFFFCSRIQVPASYTCYYPKSWGPDSPFTLGFRDPRFQILVLPSHLIASFLQMRWHVWYLRCVSGCVALRWAALTSPTHGSW